MRLFATLLLAFSAVACCGEPPPDPMTCVCSAEGPCGCPDTEPVRSASEHDAPSCGDCPCWDTPDFIRPTRGGEGTRADFGQFVRVDLQNFGLDEAFTVVLPEASAERVGRRVGVAEVWGAPVGPGFPELHVVTSANQQIDFNITLPLRLAGVRPRAIFVAVKTDSNPDVYGWTIESMSTNSHP